MPVDTGFQFRVYIAALTEEEVNNATDFERFYRVDAEDGPILTPVIVNEPFVELGTEEGAEYEKNCRHYIQFSNQEYYCGIPYTIDAKFSKICQKSVSRKRLQDI